MLGHGAYGRLLSLPRGDRQARQRAQRGHQFTPQLDRNREFIQQQLRYQLATAAYGTVAALQVLTKDDPQIAKAVELVPRARDLAMTAMRARLIQP